MLDNARLPAHGPDMRPALCLIPLLAALAGPAFAQNAPARPALLPDEVVAMAVHDATANSVVKVDVAWDAPPAKTMPGLDKLLPKEYGDTQRQHAVGSAVLWDDAGHVVTAEFRSPNPGSTFEATLPDGTRRPARLLGTDTELGISVLQLEGAATGMRPATLGASRALRVGQRLYVLGTAWGRSFILLEGMLGGISAAYADNGHDALLMTATVNPGNAGGPVFDTSGRLVGLVQGLYGVGGNANNGGLTMVLQSDDFAWAVPQLIAKGRVERARLDIGLVDLSAANDGNEVPANLPRGVGVLTLVADGAGARAGLHERDGEAIDVITGFDGVPVRSYADLRAQLDRHHAGDACTLTVWRGGQTLQMPVKLSASRR